MAAEQLGYELKEPEDKLEYALRFAEDAGTKTGLSFDFEAIRAGVEAAVFSLLVANVNRL